MLQILSDLVKEGALGRLEIVNVEARPEVAASWGVRSVPWLRVGVFELTGLRGVDEVRRLIEHAASPTGMADHLHGLLRDGELAQVLATVRREPACLVDLLPIVVNPESSVNVRLGAGAVFEEFAGQPAMQKLVGQLGGLTTNADARVRADACHYLSLAGAAEGRRFLVPRLRDDDAVVREIAEDSLNALEAAAGMENPAAL